MKSQKIAFAVFLGFTLIIFSYFFCCGIFVLEDSYTIIEGGNLKKLLPPGIGTREDALEVGQGQLSATKVRESNREVELVALGCVPLKRVSVKTIEAPEVYPSGECVGIKMYSGGLIVSGLGDFDTPEGVCPSPGGAAGLRVGDVILSIDGVSTSSVEEFVKICDSSGSSCLLGIGRGGGELLVEVPSELSTDGHRRLGIYVKNSVAGVGTMTYVSKDGVTFGALGHGISDSGTLVPMNSAFLYRAEVLDIKRGKEGVPGEIVGAIDEGRLMGECIRNTADGVYGVAEDYVPRSTAMPVCPSSHVEEGIAQMLCTVDSSGGPELFEVRIVSVNHLRQNKSKSFVVEVTDRSLLQKTGGIVQGMSGSPILQNGKLIGAVTHVFVNDPTRGYGIFIENMLAEAEKIK